MTRPTSTTTTDPGVGPHRRTMAGASTARVAASLGVALAVLLTACAASDDPATDGPDISLGTVPAPDAATSESDAAATSTPDEPSETAPNETAPNEDGTSDTGDAPPATDQATSGESTTTVLAPSPDADLPTDVTPTEPVPVTTVAGPLPVPEVRLIDIGVFDEPVEAVTADGETLLFIVQKGGTVIGFDDESNQTLLDLTDVAATTFTDAGSEQGLLGLAFHPTLDLAYVDYTDGEGDTVVAEFAHDPITFEFDPDSFREVLTIDQPFGNHNGGELDFGPDGLLYIGTGDGGSANDPEGNALDPSSRLGKILRIDPTESESGPFGVPDDNPFVGVEGAEPTIWSLGLRNPWKFSFDSLTGDLWIGDVGQNRLEEIDLAPATDGRDAGKGISFGWSAFEATDRFDESKSPDGHTLPVVSYVHEDGNCSVSGGVVARDSSFRELNGWYVYGDYCSGRVWALDTTSVTSTVDGPLGDPVVVEIATVPALTAVVDGPLGDIYALGLDGSAYRLAPA